MNNIGAVAPMAGNQVKAGGIGSEREDALEEVREASLISSWVARTTLVGGVA